MWSGAGAGYSQFVAIYLDGILCASIRAFRCSSDPEELNNSAFFASLPECAPLFPEAMPKRIAGVKGMSLQILLCELAAWCHCTRKEPQLQPIFRPGALAKASCLDFPTSPCFLFPALGYAVAPGGAPNAYLPQRKSIPTSVM